MSSITKMLIESLSPGVEFAFLLGSAETERFTPTSDVDVAVYAKEATENFRETTRATLAEALGRDVDLVMLNDIDDIFAAQVLRTGRLIVNNDPGLLLQWKVEKMARYVDFKRSRKIIEDNILRRKKHV